ncbi:hypothetical protein NDU88_011835 [Pleurodeles waltl]|uniref:Uncharacterized protein n=1 Tax=Pleurodeles waltl TaxID=8319 RepID=A0AAV7R2V0_PLEWA|nr:hypothetical protein NDU88_011835 [Pleurodeles waltl]
MMRTLTDILQRRKVTVRDIQVLLGHLNFACRVVWAGRTFCRRLGLALAGRELPHHHVRLIAGVKADLRMWGMFFKHFNGIPLQYWQVVDWDVQIFSDAAGGSGFGVYWDGKYCAESWPVSWTRGGRSIAFLELFPLIVAVCV